MIIILILSALETFTLGIYLVSIGSQETNAMFANLSLSRLVISAGVFLVGLFFLICAILTMRNHRKGKDFFEPFLVSRKKLLLAFSLSVLLIIGMIFLLTRPPEFGGDLRMVIKRLEPVFAWVMLLSTQFAFFTVIWFCAYFIVNGEKSIVETRKELLQLSVVFFAVLIIKWFVVSSASYGPGVGDEMVYYDIADSMNRGFYSIAQSYRYPPLYPFTFLPALVFSEYTFALFKIINTVVSTMIVFPIYFISRSYLDHKKSLIITIIACLNSFHLVFPRRMLSENLYYPLILWAMYLVLKKPVKKTTGLVWDILTGIVLGLLYLTRYITFAALPMFLAAWWVKPFDENDKLFKPSSRKIFRFSLIFLCVILVFGTWIFCAAQEDVPVRTAMGFFVAAETTPKQVTFINLLKWLAFYTSYAVIMFSPFLPLLLESLFSVNYSKWRDEYGRWIFQILAVLAGFMAAATRHSWRVSYNSEMPKIMMGRYLLFLAVPSLILAFFTLDIIQKGRSERNVKRDICLLAVSLGLVLLAYFTIVQPKFIHVADYFVRIETSADAYYVGVLGILFFVFIPLLYGAYYFFFSHQERRPMLWKVIYVLLVVFFISGWPGYYDQLLEKQTNSWLSSKMAELASAAIPDELNNEELTVFLPESFDDKARVEIYNGLRVRSFDNTKFFEYTDTNVSAMPTTYGLVITELGETDSGDDYLEFNDKRFQLEMISE